MWPFKKRPRNKEAESREGFGCLKGLLESDEQAAHADQKRVLDVCNFELARKEFAYFFRLTDEEAARKGGVLVHFDFLAGR